MNRIALVSAIGLALITSTLLAQSDRPKTRPVTRRKSGKITSSIKSIVIDNFCGDVTIETDAESPCWKVKLQVTNPSRSSAKLILDELEIKTRVSATGELSWTSKCPYQFAQMPGIQSCVTFYVPPGVPVRVKNKKGTTKASGLKSDTDIRMIDGDVILENLLGIKNKLNCVRSKVQAKTISALDMFARNSQTEVTNCSGDVFIDGGNSIHDLNSIGSLTVTGASQEIRAIGIDGDARITTSDAGAKIKQVKGTLELRTTHGEIVAAQVDGPATIENESGDVKIYGNVRQLNCTSKDGNLRFVTDDHRLERIQLKTTQGNVQISLPDTLRPRFNLDSKKGKVSNRFRHASTAKNQPQVVASTNTGDIYVITQPRP